MNSDYYEQLIRSEYKKMHEFLHNEEEKCIGQLAWEIINNRERIVEKKTKFSKQIQNLQRGILEIEERLDEAPLEMLQDMKGILERNEELLLQKTQQFDFIWKSHRMTGLKEILRSYETDIILGPERDSLHLIVPECFKELKYEFGLQDQPDKEKTLDYLATVLGTETFTSGKHYWEVDVEGQTEWVLGICEESVSKNENVSILSKDVRAMIGSKVNDEMLFWIPEDCFISIAIPKVGVFLNYEEGEVSFYDIEDKSILLRSPKSAFQGPVRPFFSTSLVNKVSTS
uniref:B30.2/SPRY domain-containing protein n=1 Tax=Monodelphis domestica TaxID=13616 RepID=F7DCX9_MONDO